MPIPKEKGRGKSKLISTSKTKNTTANKKKRIEKGTRALPFGSNPHSKGEFLSFLSNTFKERNQLIRKTITHKPLTTKNQKNKYTTKHERILPIP